MKRKKENKEEEEEVNYHQLSSPTVSTAHNWKQYGNQIICDSCDSQHGFYIKTNLIMTGIDKKGMPILEKRF